MSKDKIRVHMKLLPETVEKIDRIRDVKKQPRGVCVDEVFAKQKEPKLTPRLAIKKLGEFIEENTKEK